MFATLIVGDRKRWSQIECWFQVRKSAEKETARMTKIAKVSVLLLGLSLASGLALPAYAQSGATKEQVQEEMPKVARHVWDAKLASAHNAEMNQAWKAAQAAYAKGDYDKAMKKLKVADDLAGAGPNNVAN